MAQAPQYTPTTDFSDDERNNVGGRSTVRTANLDAELAAIASSINALRSNQSLNQRDDGNIRDGRVKLFTLASEVLALLASYGCTPRGNWQTATLYGLKDLVNQGGNTYIAVSPHISGVFATDLAAGKWLLFSLSASPGATQVVFTATANIAATNVQAAIEELDSDLRTLINAAIASAAAGDATLIANLANYTSPLYGSSMVGFGGDQNYAVRTIGARLLDIGASPRAFGATADGVADDTAYINAAFIYSKTLDLRNRKWRITSTIALPAGACVDLRGGSIVAVTGATPLFSYTGAKEGLAIIGGGSSDTAGQITGTCSDVLYFDGLTDQPTAASQYDRQIRIEGVHATSSTITRFATFNRACRQIFIRACMIYTQSGFLFNGKNVEAMISDSIIYSSTGVAGTYGIRLRSTGGTTYYNEGISVVNCTVDNFEISHDISDCFVYQVIGGYHGVAGALAATSGYVFQFQAPTTNLCEEIELAGGIVVAGRSRFVASASGVAYHAKIDVHNINTPGTAWAIENNASDIDINVIAKNGSGTAIGILGSNNNARITARGKFDSTYTNGIVLNGPNGAGCVIGPVSGDTIGGLVGAGRPVLLVGVPVGGTSVANLIRAVSASNINGTFAVGATIGSVAWAFCKGERGDIIINLPYSGANAATQGIQIIPPTGMVLESGSGWAATNIYLGAASGLCFVRVPYRCTSDGGGTLSVINLAGNSLTINNQAYIGLHKDI
ncbi:hypothetical protein [Roseateles depolymerans]|uniref:Uncharacterized protein n=1 Tax=Roseateles depolymerans TaxID=76731 RepID=A0A0U3MUM2_9BURK|nr:hypothetical protein [Roseateles depolymerans]ALV06707.1 hypothetical protein RD2015_2235 [Roseateles depolymerans]REG19684.1 hypothetical protein DES44_2184 [Roseateles depolymerans]